MDVGIVGTGPAAEAVETAMEDLDVRVVSAAVERLDEFDFGFVVDSAGSGAFTRAADKADRWIAVEVGGIGGHPLAGVDAAISIFDADSGCFRCLRDRVASTVTEEERADEPQGVLSAVRYAGAIAGRRVIRLLSGENDLAGTTVTADGGEHAFLPVPGCSCATGRDRTLTLSHREASIDDALTRAEQAVDDRLGLVTQVGERESYPVPYYLAMTADTTVYSDVRAAELAAGCHPDWDRAYMKAVGEALERYAAGVYDADEFREASASTLENAVYPSRFVRPDGYGDVPPDETRYWTPARSLDDGAGAWLPAEVVQYPPPEEEIKPPITTGLGLGNSTVEAALSGLYEVVERDATMLGWYSSYEPLGLSVDDDVFDALRRRARSEGLTVSTSLMTQDVDVPVLAVAVHREDGDWPQFAMGSGCDLDPVAAARSALAEALQNWMELRSMGPQQAASEGGAIGEYADFPDAAAEFTAFDHTVPAASVAGDDANGEGSAADLTGEEELAELVDRVTDAGLDPYAARITPRDVESVGFEAVRAVVPEAQPLFTGEPFFGDRIREVPETMGYESRPDREYHPFP